jgi:hypothetical protein
VSTQKNNKKTKKGKKKEKKSGKASSLHPALRRPREFSLCQEEIEKQKTKKKTKKTKKQKKQKKRAITAAGSSSRLSNESSSIYPKTNSVVGPNGLTWSDSKFEKTFLC